MKILATIFSIYILGITLTPCMDDISADNHSFEVQYHESADHPEPDDEELCSPLCSCHCCHIHIIEINHKSLDFLATHYKEFFTQPSSNVIGFIHSYWQPPRV